jgi:uncharacterized damage-inducible protein DinB
MSIRLFYDRWPQYNRRMVEVFGSLTPDQLAIRPAPDLMPIWATVGHTAAMRLYWLCNVLNEPGAEATPFGPAETAVDWSDDLGHPRTGDELRMALETTFGIVEACLDRWTPAMLEEVAERYYGDQRQLHSRASILQRLLTHEAWHAGELSQTLGIQGLPQVDLWRTD